MDGICTTRQKLTKISSKNAPQYLENWAIGYHCVWVFEMLDYRLHKHEKYNHVKTYNTYNVITT